MTVVGQELEQRERKDKAKTTKAKQRVETEGDQSATSQGNIREGNHIRRTKN